MLKEIEACIEAARAFLYDVVDWLSPHCTDRGHELLEELEAAGYVCKCRSNTNLPCRPAGRQKSQIDKKPIDSVTAHNLSLSC